MGKKRKNEVETVEKIERKIRRLQRKLESKNGKDSSIDPADITSDEQGREEENLIDLLGYANEAISNQDIGEPIDLSENVANTDQSTLRPQPTLESPSEPSPHLKEEVLDDSVLEILGDNPGNKKKTGPSIHNSIAERWTDILTGGLDKEVKSALLKNYPAPSNCPLVNAPQLNLEIKAAISESVNKKDKIHELKQKQLGAALSAIGQAMDILIKNKDQQALRAVSDAARLLCDQQYFESLTRRHMILAVLNKTTKDAIQGVKPDEWLFGKDLNERIKACKAVNRSALDLKNRSYRPAAVNKYNYQATASTSAYQPNTLNWRGPPQPTYRPQGQGPSRGGHRQVRPALLNQQRTLGPRNIRRY